jgi:hypothetical protein
VSSDGNPTRAGLPARFAAVLEAEAALFQELAELMPVQRQALLDGDRAALEESSSLADTLATRFRMLEQERVRLESESGGDLLASPDEIVRVARARLLTALQGLMRDGAVNGTLLARLGDTVAARQAAVASLFGSAYLADGRPAALRASGVSLSKEI